MDDFAKEQREKRRDGTDPKEVFIRCLKPVVVLCDRTVQDLRYISDHPWGKVVRIVYGDHCQDINITGSSFLWIAKRVFESLEY